MGGLFFFFFFVAGGGGGRGRVCCTPSKLIGGEAGLRVRCPTDCATRPGHERPVLTLTDPLLRSGGVVRNGLTAPVPRNIARKT